MLAAYDDKSAYAQTIFGLCAGPGQVVHTFGAPPLHFVAMGLGFWGFWGFWGFCWRGNVTLKTTGVIQMAAPPERSCRPGAYTQFPRDRQGGSDLTNRYVYRKPYWSLIGLFVAVLLLELD